MSFLRKYWIEIAVLFALLLMITAAWLGEFCQASERVQQEVLRLHILAPALYVFSKSSYILSKRCHGTYAIPIGYFSKRSSNK